VKSPVAALAAAVLLLTACATGGPPLEQRTSQGPTARQFWMLRSMLANNREPSLDERRHFEDQLDLRIQQYLAQHPEDANSLQVTSFRFDKRAVTGLAKEQVLILLGPPETVTTDQAEMEKLARRYWKEMRGNVTEAWVYPLGWRFFFAGPRLAEITQYLERD
jgi:hypothetical protein